MIRRAAPATVVDRCHTARLRSVLSLRFTRQACKPEPRSIQPNERAMNPSPHVLVAGRLYAATPRHVEAREARPSSRDEAGKWSPGVEAREAYDVWDVSVLTSEYGGGFCQAVVKASDLPDLDRHIGQDIAWVCRPYADRKRGSSGTWFNVVSFYFVSDALAPALSSIAS